MKFQNQRLQKLLISACCLQAWISTSDAQQSPTDSLTQEQQATNLESFDYIWTTVKESYWDADLGGVDWVGMKSSMRPRVAAAQSMDEARKCMNDMLDVLDVSHFSIIPAEAYREVENEGPRGRYVTGLDVRIVDDQVLVTQVDKDSPAALMNVQTGWQIVRIGETDIRQRYREISADLEDHPHRRTILVDAVKSRLTGKPDQKINIVFLDSEDQEVALAIGLVEPRGKKARFGHIPEFHVWIETRKLDETIGYIRFNAFMDPAYLMSEFNRAMSDFRGCPGIVIDVRGNGGGLGEMAMAMMGWHLQNERRQIGTVILRDNVLKMFVHPRAEPYHGRVVVLIDEMSISAAEFFASGMKDLGLAHLIGTTTAGAVLGSVIERLPNGDGFQYARANYISQSTGETLEGKGVPPHQLVLHRRDALLQGRDLPLEAAIQWINYPVQKDAASSEDHDSEKSDL